MNFLKRLFGQKKSASQEAVVEINKAPDSNVSFDVSQLQLPRVGRSFEEALEDQKRAIASKTETGAGSVIIYTNYQDMAIMQGEGVPMVRAFQGRAKVSLRLGDLSRAEKEHLGDAVTQNRVLLAPLLALCPTSPILGLKFMIYDDLTNPLTAEGPPAIQGADVQDFLQEVLNAAGGDFLLFAGADAELLGSGRFALRMPPLTGAGYPYTPTDQDRRRLWELLEQAAKHLKSIPPANQDYLAAVRYYFQQTSLTSSLATTGQGIIPLPGVASTDLRSGGGLGNVPSAYEDWVAELLQIGRTTGFLATRDFFDAPGFSGGRNIRARELGEILHAHGGLNLMLQAHERVRNVLGGVQPRELESAWNGIGLWQG